MPLTQDRYLDLLSIARELIDKAQILLTHAERVKNSANRNQSAEHLYGLILELYAGIDAIRLNDHNLMQKFLKEEAHFEFNAKRNRRSAEYMRRYRARIRLGGEAKSNDAFLESSFKDEQAQSEQAYQPVQPTFEPRKLDTIQPETRDYRQKEESRDEALEIAKPISKQRNPMLDQITPEFMLARLKSIQEQTGEGPTSSDIANLYRKGGADENEVAERTSFWIDQLLATKQIEKTPIPFQYRVL